MQHITPITEHIIRIRVPFFDIFTTVFLVKTEKGNLLFDTATYDTDITEIIFPALEAIGISPDSLTHIFISHPHGDHAGGIPAILATLPDVTVVAGSQALCEQHPDMHLQVTKDGDTLLDHLVTVALPGHTADAIALFDTRTKTLLSGDCLQLYGIYGSGGWGANITFPAKHLAALDRLALMDISAIHPAHNYHPEGDTYIGKEAIGRAISACREPLFLIRDMIKENPALTDEELTAKYNQKGLPTLGVRVVTAVRLDLL